MRKKVTTISVKLKDTPIRVAAYCRVSTGDVTQQSSLQNQEQHYRHVISSQKGWIYAGVYSDPGISGTHMASRPGLQKMLADALAGKIDLILTKSISRFARNTAECLNAVRMLVSYNVHIYFEKEQIHTKTMDSELLLTLHSTFAREESRIISSNVRWAVVKRFESGTYKYSKAPYGFTLENGSFKINEEQAPIVRYIFSAVLQGTGTPRIAADLNERAVPSATVRLSGEPGVWTASRIQGMIRNPVYIGDILMQKTYSDDQFYRKINHGEKAQYYMDHHHEGIVSREVFFKANEALVQRGKEKGVHSRYEDPAVLNTPKMRSPFSGKLYCAACGQKLKRITQSAPSGSRCYWGCTMHLKDTGKCNLKRIPELLLEHTFLTMLNKLKFGKDVFFRQLIGGLSKEVRIDSPDADRYQAILDDNERKRNELLTDASTGKIEVETYQAKCQELLYVDSIALQALERIDHGSLQLAEAKILKNVIDLWEYHTEGFPGDIFTQICEQVIVSKDHVSFHLKCGCVLNESSLLLSGGMS